MTTKIEQTDDLSGDGIEIDLWVRRPVCGPRTTIIDRLGSLRAAGHVAEFAVTTWPEEIVLTGANRQDDLLETIEAFESWAADHGLSLRPPFETRTASLLVGDSEDVLVTPMMLAVAYEDGELVGIYPCTDGTKTWTIEEFLDGIEAGVEESPPGVSEQPSPTEQGTS